MLAAIAGHRAAPGVGRTLNPRYGAATRGISWPHTSWPLGLSGTDGDRVTADEQKSDQGLGWFGRIAFEPQDRNFIGLYFDTGLTYKGLIPTRDADTLGFAFAYAQLSSGAQQAAINNGSVGG